MTNEEQSNPSLTQRRLAGRISAGVAVVVAAYVLAWFATAQIIKSQVARWIAVQEADGIVVTIGTQETKGFPGRIKVVAHEVTAVSPSADSGWTWRSAEVRVSAWPLGFLRPSVDMAGRQSLAGVTTPPNVPVWVEAGTARLKLALDVRGRLRTARLELAEASGGILEAPAIMRLGQGTVVLTLLRPGTTEQTENQSATLPATSRLTAELHELALTDFLPAPLNQPIARAAGTVEVTGHVTDGPLPQVLETWRAEGGTVEVREAAVEWPPLRMSASGTLALDDSLQPLGSLNASIQGGGAAIDALAQAGHMGTEEAGLAHLALAAVSRRGADGVTPEFNVPLTIQDRRLSAGPIAVMEIPAIEWRRAQVP